MWFFRKLIILRQSSNHDFGVKRIPTSMFPPSLSSCSSVSSAPASIFQHQLVKQFQISMPTRAYSYSHTHPHPSTQVPPPSFHPSLCPFSDPISQWNHQELIPISALAGGPKQCTARLNPAVNSQPLLLRPSLCRLPSFTPDSISAYFSRVLDEGLDMWWMLLCTVYRACLNTLRVSSRAQQ